MSRKKNMVLGLSATVLTVGAGLGVTGMASATTTPTPTPSSSVSTDATDPGIGDLKGPGGRGGHDGNQGGGHAEMASELAAKLGVDEAKVTEALKTFREENKPATKPSEGERPDRAAMESAMAASLAKSLGIDEAKVTSALEEIRAAAQAERGAALKTRLYKAVYDGTLTQAEADAVTKAIEAGVIGGGH